MFKLLVIVLLLGNGGGAAIQTQVIESLDEESCRIYAREIQRDRSPFSGKPRILTFCIAEGGK